MSDRYSDEEAYLESLLPTPEEDYEDRAHATFARRLALMLVRNGTLSEREATELWYPSEEQMSEAEQLH